MILIQDGSQPPNIDKPLRIIGDPYKVQVILVKITLIKRENTFAVIHSLSHRVCLVLLCLASEGDG